MSDEKEFNFLGDQENNNATVDDKVDDDVNNDHVDYNNDDESLNLAKQVWISFHCSCFEELKQLFGFRFAHDIFSMAWFYSNRLWIQSTFLWRQILEQSNWEIR